MLNETDIRHIVLDTETTGLSPTTAAVTEIAAIVGHIKPETFEFVELARFQSLARPPDQYLGRSAEKALEITNISRKMLKKAEPDVMVANQFHVWIEEWTQGKPVFLHAFNNSFDKGMLDNDRWRIPTWVWGDCIMRKSMELMGPEGALIPRRGTWKYPSLEEARVFFEVAKPAGVAHRAMFDTDVAAEIYSAIREEEAYDE